jgi:hypothetical protein
VASAARQLRAPGLGRNGSGNSRPLRFSFAREDTPELLPFGSIVRIIVVIMATVGARAVEDGRQRRQVDQSWLCAVTVAPRPSLLLSPWSHLGREWWIVWRGASRDVDSLVEAVSIDLISLACGHHRRTILLSEIVARICRYTRRLDISGDRDPVIEAWIMESK